jgi:N-methylhydantoinase A
VRDEGSAVEVVNWKARLTVMLEPPNISKGKVAGAKQAKPHSIRKCFFGGRESVPTRIFRETNIVEGLRIDGPAIIEEPTTTLVVNPNMSVTVSAHGNYLLHTHH